MSEAFITGVGKFLPGEPISQQEMGSIIARNDKTRRNLGKATLRKNKIETRHYSLKPDGSYSHTNAEMAAAAIQNALANAKLPLHSLQCLATSTTQGDFLVPGFASAVHHELKVPDIELASFQSVCASSLMAVKYAANSVRLDEVRSAVASGSEFSSRWFQGGYYDPIYDPADCEPDPELEFLRWTLSDGAGAVVIETSPKAASDGPSLRIDWIKQKSFADKFPACMYAGSSGNNKKKNLPWSLYANPKQAYEAGAIVLRQDMRLLYQLFPAWMGFYLELVDDGLIEPERIEVFLPHYSAHALKVEMVRLLTKTGAMIPEDRWYNNTSRCGNVGSASIFVMLAGLLQERRLQPGQRILCFVPESGWAISSFMQLTVV